MKRKALYIGAVVFWGMAVISSPVFSVPPEPQSKTVKRISRSKENSAISAETTGKDTVKVFGRKIAGTYIVVREPDAGISRILTIFADGNLSSIQSIQFNGGVPGIAGGFSNQQGVWKRIGPCEIRATALDLSYNFQTGDFRGMAVASYDLQFDKTFQTVTGMSKGKVFSPGINPLNPGDAEPIAEFNDTFEAQRVVVHICNEEGG